MKTKLLILLSLILFSCKSTKDYGCYSSFVEKDTVTVVTEHVNYDGKCHESITVSNVVSDTVYIFLK
jgi:hypothetical protein